MELTNEIVEQYGFKRINNSMWRLGDITLQNGWTHEGENIYERILNTKKAYRACIKGKFYRMIKNEQMLEKLVRGQNDDASDSNCTIHGVSDCGCSRGFKIGYTCPFNRMKCDRECYMHSNH